MDLGQLKKQALSLQGDSRTKNVVIVVLSLALLVSVVGWMRTKETIVLVPPHLDERVEVTFTKASAGYKKAWALFISELMGNISAGTADAVLIHLDALFAPSEFHRLRSAITKQVEEIKHENLTVTMEPRDMAVREDLNRVYVIGRVEVQGPARTKEVMERTYEYEISMRFGRPWVTFFDVHDFAANPNLPDPLAKEVTQK